MKRKPTKESQLQRRKPKADCSKCLIERINNFPPFPKKTSSLRLPVAVSKNPVVTLTAVPSNPDCPCDWGRDFRLAGHRVATGATLRRRTLNAGPSPLIEKLNPRFVRVKPLVTVADCTLTIDLPGLDQALRQGIGLANSVVVIELLFRVKCNGRWREIRLVVDD